MEQGVVTDFAPGLRAILAPNPSPMTETGTRTYLIGAGPEVAVIDPGPRNPPHLKALLRALGPGQRISHILVTHAHLDHSPGARDLAAETGAPILAFGPPEAGRTALMQTLAQSGELGGGEGVDLAFAPDRCLRDGEILHGQGWRLRAHWTPGHMGNHLCFEWLEERVVFTGDLVMGWASSLISPPDGDLGQFYAALSRLASLSAQRFYPAHGAPILEPAARLTWLRAHREARTEALRTTLRGGAQSLSALTDAVYTDIPPALKAAAARNLLAHLIWLIDAGEAVAHPSLGPTATFRLNAEKTPKSP